MVLFTLDSFYHLAASLKWFDLENGQSFNFSLKNTKTLNSAPVRASFVLSNLCFPPLCSMPQISTLFCFSAHDARMFTIHLRCSINFSMALSLDRLFPIFSCKRIRILFRKKNKNRTLHGCLALKSENTVIQSTLKILWSLRMEGNNRCSLFDYLFSLSMFNGQCLL